MQTSSHLDVLGASDVGRVIDRARLFVLISGLESDLRQLIRKWVLPYKDEEAAFGGRYALLRDRANAEGAEQDSSVLDYADFSDSFEFINRQKEMFPAEIAAAVRSLTPDLAQFIGPRNRVMHARPLQPDDLNVGLRLCLDLLGSRIPMPTVRDLVERIRTDPDWSPVVHARPADVSKTFHNLPLPEFDETGLLGRAKESAQLMRRLVSERDPIVTLVGEGGMGKTALAVNTLWDIAYDQSNRFEAILWASLKTERLTAEGIEELENAVRDVLGVTHVLGSQLDDRFDGSAESLGAMLEGIRTLIAIDNVETANSEEVVQFYDAMPDTCKILLTSRVGLGQIERRIPIGPLADRPASQLLRTLADRRGLSALAQLSPAQLTGQVRRLRGNPLAIRWYVEAVASGADPKKTIEDQTDVLRFCLETIYEGLSGTSRSCLGVLHASGRALDLPELAVLANLRSDELNRALQDLQRRSLVEVQLSGPDGLRQQYALTDATAQYLSTVARPSQEILRDTQSRIEELRRSEEQRQRLSLDDVTKPAYFEVVGDEQKAVAHLLQKALLGGRSNPHGPPPDLTRAMDLAPDYFEVHRVAAYLAAQRGELELARQSYERAYELANTDSGRARVAFFFSWLLGNQLKDPLHALELAQVAHEELHTPATACRLAQINMYLTRYDAAEQLLRYAASADDVRSGLIARTQLVSLAKRRVELARREHQSGAAIMPAAMVLRETNAYLNSGVTDTTLREKTLDLVAEIVGAGADCTEVGDARTWLLETLNFAQAHSKELLFHSDRHRIYDNLGRLLGIHDLPKDIGDSASELRAAIAPQEDLSEVSQARVLWFDASKGYGFLDVPDSADNAFFSSADLVNSHEAILLLPQAIVRCTLETGERGLRARKVRPDRAFEEELLAKRRCVVKRRGEESFLFAQDTKTKIDVFMGERAFAKDDWNRATVGKHLVADLSITDAAPAAVKGSIRLFDE